MKYIFKVVSIKKITTIIICMMLLIAICPYSFAADKYSLEYDDNGNLIQDLEYYYEYDSQNQLIKISDFEGNVVARYYYDEAGQRIKRVVGGKTVYYVNKNFIREKDSSGINDVIYYYDGDSLVGKKENGERYYYHTDLLGSVDLVTDSSKRIVEDIDYTPFGESEGESRYQFTGQEKDKESDLMYYNARYYSPFLMHFTQPDTMLPNVYDPQQLNRYSYARNNPVKYKDDSGHWIHVALGAAIGGLIGGGVNLVKQICSGRSMFDGSVSWKEVGKSAAIGAGAGAVGAATFGIGTYAYGTRLAGYASGGAIAGFAGGRAAQLTSNVMNGESITNNMLNVGDMARDITIGTVTGAAGYGVIRAYNHFTTPAQGKYVQINNLHVTQPSVGQGRVDYYKSFIKNNGLRNLEPVRYVKSPTGKNLIIDGHHRMAAAKKMGYNRIPAMEVPADPNAPYGRYVSSGGTFVRYRTYDETVVDALNNKRNFWNYYSTVIR